TRQVRESGIGNRGVGTPRPPAPPLPLPRAMATSLPSIPVAASRPGSSPVPDLANQIRAIEAESGARAIAVSFFDTETGTDFGYQDDRWFHAASTIKLAILLGVFASIHRGWLVPQSRLHVRNRFLSASDGHPFRVAAERDANSVVHAAVG